MASGLHLQEICFCDVCFNFGAELDRNDTGYVSWACRCVAADHVCKGMFDQDMVDGHWY